MCHYSNTPWCSFLSSKYFSLMWSFCCFLLVLKRPRAFVANLQGSGITNKGNYRNSGKASLWKEQSLVWMKSKWDISTTLQGKMLLFHFFDF